MKLISALCLSLALLGATLAFAQEAAPTAAKPAATAGTDAPDLAAILKKLNELDAHIAALERKVQSISRFLGDTQSYGSDTVDDRLRDLQRAVDDVQRGVDRIR